MSIPKIIHYCWFGGNPLPELAERCIRSWKDNCPDYEILRWDESNTFFQENSYSYEAYEAGKYSFVSDVVRLRLVYEHGGIYLDTDVELLKSLDPLLSSPAYFGIEAAEANIPKINTGLGFGAEAGNPIVGALLDSYQSIHFRNSRGSFDLTACPIRNSEVLDRFGFVRENRRQSLNAAEIYPSEYFCPMDWFTGKTSITENTISNHHFANAWQTPAMRFKNTYHHLRWQFLGIGFDGWRREIR